MDQPIQQILLRLEISEHLTTWAVELGEYDLSYESRTAIKTQVLTDFLIELTFSVSQDVTSDSSEPFRWTLYVNGSSNSDGSGAGLLLEDPHREICSYALRFNFSVSNNEAD